MPIHYTDPQVDVPPGVNFLDAEQTRVWVENCELGKPWREPMRRQFADIVSALPSGAKVLELGSGPGYLAKIAYVERIADTINGESENVRLSMGAALMGIGKRSAVLNKAAFLKDAPGAPTIAGRQVAFR